MLVPVVTLSLCVVLAGAQTTQCTNCDAATITTTSPAADGLNNKQFLCFMSNRWRAKDSSTLVMNSASNQNSKITIQDQNLIIYELTTTQSRLSDVTGPQDFTKGDGTIVRLTITCSFVTPSPTSSAPTPTPTERPTASPIIANAKQKCEQFVQQEQGSVFVASMKRWGHSLPRCPPTETIMATVGDFSPLPANKYCVLWPNLYKCDYQPYCTVRSPQPCVTLGYTAYYARGKQESGYTSQVMLTCVYRAGVLVTGPYRGYYTKIDGYDPLGTPRQVRFWEGLEGYIRQVCCYDPIYCNNFYKIRPTNDGSRWRGWISPGYWGDPHLQSLDGLNMTFNGVGEFIMIDHPSVKMQTRMEQAGPSKQGSVITALVLQFVQDVVNSTSNLTTQLTSTVQVEVNTDNTTQQERPLSVFVNFTAGGVLLSENEVRWNRSQFPPDATNISEILLFNDLVLKVSARKLGDQIRVSTFLAAFSIDVNFAAPTPPLRRLLEFSLRLSEQFANQTRGILGNFNGIASDDLILPNGTVLNSASATSRDIFEFGSAYRVSQSSTLFGYRGGQNASFFVNSSYVPMLVPDFGGCPNASQVEAQAIQTCGNSQECLLDIAVTCDLAFGARTKEFQVELSRIRALVNTVITCNPPCANGICRLNNTCDCFTGWNGTICDIAGFPELGVSSAPTQQPSLSPTQITPVAADDNNNDNNLSAGVIAAIVIGCVVFVGCLVVGVWFFLIKEKTSRDDPVGNPQERQAMRDGNGVQHIEED